jgi:hypothetical protein
MIMKKLMILTGSLLVLAGVVQAEAADPGAAPRAALKRLLGTWHGKGTMKDGGKTVTVDATIECVETSGGAGVRCIDRFTGIPGLASYEETDLFGYDPGDGLVHMFTVTNGGETHDHKGGVSGNVFALMFSGPQDGQLFSECLTITFLNDHTMRGESRSFLGAGRGPVLDMTVTR